MHRVWMHAVAAAAALAALVPAQEGKREHIIVTPDDVKWVDGPPSLPPGAKMAVIEGDPSKEGYFMMRLKVPAGYKIPAHQHPGDERVTVISGSFAVGFGDKADESKAKKLGPGSYISMTPKTNHFAFFAEESVIQLSTIGPWTVTYANPDEDPRKAMATFKCAMESCTKTKQAKVGDAAPS